MSISSIILGLLASGFAFNSAGNLKGAWNKSVDSYKGTSFFSPQAKKGLDIADKSAKTLGAGLIAIQSFTQDKVPTVALQSVVNILEGKLPKTGKQLSKNISQVGEEASSIFASKRSDEVIDNKTNYDNVLKTTNLNKPEVSEPQVSKDEKSTLESSEPSDSSDILIKSENQSELTPDDNKEPNPKEIVNDQTSQ
jgi:hypothetical protein